MTKYHYSGELAYYDTFSGLVKCKVLSVLYHTVMIKITAKTNPVYKHNEILKSNHLHVIPRDSIVTRDKQYKILNNYKWVNS